MKRLFIVLLTILLTLFVSGCDKGESSVDISLLPEIMMIKVHENYAWGRHQSITVIDRDGNQYSQSNDTNDDEKPNGWVELSEEGWYESLLGIAENGESGGTLSANVIGSIHRNAGNFAEWNALPRKDYGEIMMDYGKDALYGVYLDDNGEPRLAWLAEYGDNPYCADNSQVMKFVNGLKIFDYKFK